MEESAELAAQATAELDLLGSDIGSGSISLGSLVDLDGLLSDRGGLLGSGRSSSLLDGGRGLLNSSGGSSLLGSLNRGGSLLDGSGSSSLLGNGLLLGSSRLLLLGGLLLEGTEELANERLALLLLGRSLLGSLFSSSRLLGSGGSLLGLSLSDGLGSNGLSGLLGGSSGLSSDGLLDGSRGLWEMEGRSNIVMCGNSRCGQ